MTKTKNQTISEKELVKLFIGDMIEIKKEAIEQLNAERYERSNERKGYRNGYKKRKLNTIDGELILDKPDIGSGLFTTSAFDK